MPTLILNAPKYQANGTTKRTFESTMAKEIGSGYALNSTIREDALNAKTVILIDKTSRKLASGRIVKIEANGAVTGNGIPRFDVYLAEMKRGDYKSFPLNRNGVAIL